MSAQITTTLAAASNIGRLKLLPKIWVAAHVAVGGGGAVDGVLEAETLDDGVGAHVEEGLLSCGYLAVGHVHMGGAVGVHIESHRLGHADGVGHLHQHLVADTRSHHVLGDMARGVGRRAVHLRGVLAAEGAAAVGTAAAVGVDDNLAAREARVAVGTADDELARGVDEQFIVAALAKSASVGVAQRVQNTRG